MSDAINHKMLIVECPDLAKIMPMELRDAGVRVFNMGQCRILITNEPVGWHLSISCADRLPTYSELVTARYRLLPAVTEMSMHFPPMDEFVNIHPYTLHLYQTR